MEPLSQPSLPPSNPGFTSPLLPPHCIPSHQYLVDLSVIFNTCLPTQLTLLSTVFGLLSITSWLFSQIPQIIKNYRNRSVDGLSLLFLMNWFLGDLCNFAGAIILRQMFFQKVIGGYYVLVDVALMGQYIWYGILPGWRRQARGYVAIGGGDGGGSFLDGEEEERKGGEGTEPLVIEGLSLSPSVSESSSMAGSYASTPAGRGGESLTSEKPKPKTKKKTMRTWSGGNGGGLPGSWRNSAQTMFMLVALVALASGAPEGRNSKRKYLSPFGGVIEGVTATSASGPAESAPRITVEALGVVISWVSTSLYCTSRLPQLYKNYIRRSTSGLSILLFIAAFFGNLFYSLSLLTNPLAWSDFEPYGGGGIAGEDGSRWSEWWRNSLPFFLGASGVLCQDALVFMQWIWWEKGRKQVIEEDDEDEVVVVVVAEEIEAEAEEERLLIGRRAGTGYGALRQGV